MDASGDSADCIRQFKNYLGDKNALPVPTSDEIKVVLETFSKSENFWEEHFVMLYYTARSGTKAEKNLLRQELDLTEHHDSPYRENIRRVSNWPGRFPTFESLNKLIHKWKVDAPAKIRIAKKKFNEAKDKKYKAEEKGDILAKNIYELQSRMRSLADYDNKHCSQPKQKS